MTSVRSVARAAHDLMLRPVLLEQEHLRLLSGSIAARQLLSTSITAIRDAEFRVFSQFGEDGIIQFLVQNVPMTDDSFVEIGVEDYRESNTRFLLQNNGWRGLIIDAGRAHLRFTQRRRFRWRYDLTAVQGFVDRENVNALLTKTGFKGDIGLLSIDIDGNDYWLWNALEAVTPRIVVIEYNSLFGPTRAVTVPYDPRFDRTVAHWSTLYFGASLPAICRLAEERGYRFLGSNSAGNNAFFVRDDVAGALPALRAEEGWVRRRFCESLGPDGKPTYVSDHTAGRRLIEQLPLVDVTTGTTLRVGDLDDA